MKLQALLTTAIALALLGALAPTASADFSQPQEDVWLGGPPSEADLDRFAEQGVGLVIDLRTAAEGVAEAETAATERGLRWVNHPLGMDMADDELVAQVGTAIAEARARGEAVLLHCASGNRAGEVWALHQVKQGGDPARALADAEAAGTTAGRLERLQDTLLGK